MNLNFNIKVVKSFVVVVVVVVVVPPIHCTNTINFI